MIFGRNLFVPALLLSLAGLASAASITTTYAGGNGNSIGGAVYYDLDVLALGGITITGVDVNTVTSGSAVSINIYTRSGTYSGFETSSAGWTLVSSGAGTGQGVGVATPIDVGDFFLGSGVTGIAIENVDFKQTYSNGVNNYANSDVSLTTGSANNTAFSSSANSPRTWNGTIYYTNGASSVPEPGTVSLMGLGLAGLVWTRFRRSGR